MAKKKCAKFCGRGCTLVEYDEAKRLGKQAISELKDKRGWKVVVWENLGWHAKVVKGGLSIHMRDWGYGAYYSAYLSIDKSGGGESFWSGNRGQTKDINEAIREQKALAKAFQKKVNQTIREVFA